MALNRYNPDPFSHPFLHGGFDDFFMNPLWPSTNTRPFSLFPRSDPLELMPVLPSMIRDEDMRLMRSSPGYEINESDTKYQVAVDVPGIKPEDMKVKIEPHGDQQVLHISGSRKIERTPSKDDKDKTSYFAETTFEKRFSVGPNVDIDHMTANLSNGVLVLSAPKKEKKENLAITIPITEAKAISEEKKE